MGGYLGGDASGEHALVIHENAIHAAQQMLVGRVLTHCGECGDSIPEARRAYASKVNMKCEFCVNCQPLHDKSPSVRMLDRVL